VSALGSLSPRSDSERVDLLRALEELSCAAAGAQARITADFVQSQRAEQEEAGLPSRDIGKGIAAQVALARRESPFRGSRHVGLALALLEMPHTAAALSAGQITEWRATIMARETGCLSLEDRRAVDAELAARPGGLGRLGDRATEHESRRVAYRLDPHAFTRRAARAESERHVSVRPAPDTMTFVTGLLPVRQGVAVHAALARHADTLRSTGDARSRGQIMADTLVERVTGQATAAAVPVEVQVVISDAALLGDDPAPAEVPGFGPVPAPHARRWLADTDAAVFLRRLYASPDLKTLVAMDSTRRTFTGGLRRFITVRDRTCRTPWCDAPIRHIDHPRRATDGGPTTVTNSQGLCEACNHAKEAAGWRARTMADEQTVETTTPTGHRYRSTAPPLSTGPPPPKARGLTLTA
jgi:hypothetical protein